MILDIFIGVLMTILQEIFREIVSSILGVALTTTHVDSNVRHVVVQHITIRREQGDGTTALIEPIGYQRYPIGAHDIDIVVILGTTNLLLLLLFVFFWNN